VQQARQNEAATQAEIANIESLLGGLQDEAAEFSREAQLKGEEYNVAQDALAAASDKAGRLNRQAEDAANQAQFSSRRAGQLIAQSARTGGTDLTLALLLSSDSSDLLASLGTMSKLTEQSTYIYRQAILDQNAASAMTDQAKLAEAIRQEVESQAQTALDEAQSAADAVQAKLDAQQAAADQMYEQLAALKGTTAALEQQYIAGLTPPSTPTEPTTPTTPSDPAPSDPTPPSTTPDPPVSSAVEGAIAYAYAQIGDWYVFGGSGPDTWDCSGLTKASYAAVGVYIGIHSSNSQYNYLSGQGRLVSINNLQRGDLLFYSSGGSTGATKYHTTIYLGNNQMIEAQVPGTQVTVSRIRYGDLVPYAGRPTG